MVNRSYAYPAHDALRLAWMAYQPRGPVHEDDRILYLAGEENLELPGYRQLGYRPDQLLTCEHDPRRFPHVLANGQGVNVAQGNIADAIAALQQWEWPRLRGAWLDFDGNSHTYTDELLKLAAVLPSPRGSTLGVTSFAARDNEALVQGTVNTCKFLSGLENLSQFMREYGTQLRQYEHLLRFIRHGESTPTSHFQREMGLLWWLVLMFGSVDLPKGERYYRTDGAFLDRSANILDGLTRKVEGALSAGSQSRMVWEFDPTLRDLLAERKVSVWITHLERYAFWSQNRQPMRTWFVKVQPLIEGTFAPTMQELLVQVWKLACRSPLIYIDEQGGRVQIDP